MEKITSLANELKNSVAHEPRFDSLTLNKGELFGWDHTACAITYNPNVESADQYLLHEFGHALLNHTEYAHDIDLIRMEREAWNKASEIANNYGLKINDEIVEDALDTYRDWLHSRSRCPHCQATGIERSKHYYKCLSCHTEWHVNEARGCSLRRFTKKHPL